MMGKTISGTGLPVPVSQCRVCSLVWSVRPAGSPPLNHHYASLLILNLTHLCWALVASLCFAWHRFYSGPQGPAELTGVCIMKRVWGERKTRSRVRQSTPCCARNTLLFFFGSRLAVVAAQELLRASLRTNTCTIQYDTLKYNTIYNMIHYNTCTIQYDTLKYKPIRSYGDTGTLWQIMALLCEFLFYSYNNTVEVIQVSDNCDTV